MPRLAGFTRVHPGVDIRIAANNEIVVLERSGIDVAIRYAPAELAPGGSKLFGEDVVPVCSPALAGDPARPLARPEDLHNHVLLHLAETQTSPWLVWTQWLEAAGIPDLRPAGALHFSHYDQLIQAAVKGQGVALGRMPLLREPVRSGELVAPFKRSIVSPRCYFVLRSPRTLGNADVDAFERWLHAEAACVSDAPKPSASRAGVHARTAESRSPGAYREAVESAKEEARLGRRSTPSSRFMSASFEARDQRCDSGREHSGGKIPVAAIADDRDDHSILDSVGDAQRYVHCAT